MAHCRVSGCNRKPSHWGHYCSSHKSRERRHGDARQEGITKAHLAPYVKAIRTVIERNHENPAWADLDAAWQEVVDENRAAVDAIQRSGRPFIGWEHQAQTEIVRLAQYVKSREIVENVLALYLMAYEEPRRIKTDRAFKFQLVRRVRALTEVNAGVTWDQHRRRTKRVYRDLPPRATEHMAELIVAALGAAGVNVAQHEAAKAAAKQRQKTQTLVSLGKLK
jgi:hypothetical protein